MYRAVAAFDTKGNVGVYGFGGGGMGAGTSGSVGGSVQFSNTETIFDLGGDSFNSSVTVGRGPAASIDTFVSGDGTVKGGGFTAGIGGGKRYSRKDRNLRFRRKCGCRSDSRIGSGKRCDSEAYCQSNR